MNNYEILDIGLASEGRQRIDWVGRHMPLMSAFKETFDKLPEEQKPFHGVKVSMCMHLEPKTGYLSEVLAAGGAQLTVCGSNVLSTQDSTAAALAAAGISVYAVHGECAEDYSRHIEMCLAPRPNIIIDDGSDLVGMLHTKRPELAEELWGGCEETTTGIIRLKALEREGKLMFPMIAVNDAKCKHMFDNRYGTGQSVWDSILRNTNLIVAAKTVVVAGYGWCGRGIALRAAALGASVIVTEIDPVKAIEARMDGYRVLPMKEAAVLGDIFVSATGCCKIITTQHFPLLKEGAILTNAGHFNVEVDMEALESYALRSYEARRNVTAYELPTGRTVHVIGEGKLVNIAAADGHPAEIMDMSFAVQLHSALYVLENRGKLAAAVIDVSEEIDRRISGKLLEVWGVEIDKLSAEQEKYLNSWEV